MVTTKPLRPDTFVFYLSCDINLPVRVRIDRLLGRLPALQHARQVALNADGDAVPQEARAPALYVVAALCALGEVLALPARSPFAPASADGCTWGAWLAFPIKYRDLPHDAQLAVTVWSVREGAPPVPAGGAAMLLFSKKGRLKTGLQRVCLWPERAADVACPSATPGKLPVAERGELGRLEQMLKRYERGELAAIDWLDALALTRIRQLRVEEEQKASSTELSLEMELPVFAHAVIWQQAAPAPVPAQAVPGSVGGSTGDRGGLALVLVPDPEVGRESPAELKAAKLARGRARGLEDRGLKPNTAEREAIEAIIKAPPNRVLSAEERALIWRFRSSLTADPCALTKVLRCMDWGDAREARAAVELVARWAPIGLADALELLSPSFTNPEVRATAVAVLRKAEDEEVRGVLLQLVQALRYEPADDSRLAAFLVQRAARQPTIAIPLHWYLYVEWDDAGFGARAAAVHKRLTAALAGDVGGPGEAALAGISAQMALMAQLRHLSSELRGSAARKAEQLQAAVREGGACGDLATAGCPLPLDPTVPLDGIIASECGVFKSALSPLRLTFRTRGPGTQELAGSGEAAALPPPAVVEGSDAAADGPAQSLGPVGGGRYQVIYKRGDDLRQDQLVVQIFSLMDRLLKRENLDLRLTPYRVLATSPDDGLIECIPSMALATVIAEHRSITRYLALHNPDPEAPLGLRPEVLDAFVKSCAGYCVMTYILGVGDRHNDNLMLAPDGRLFHIDFGYIMGRDPKPWPPPFKLNREMVDAMGGADSEPYRRFRAYACEAYNILRKSASLILSLFHLMAGSTIPDIRTDPEKAMLKLQEKLRLEEDDEVAIEWMQQLINESSSQVMANIMETTHRWAQALR
ncbi:hypothetical protein WJX81_007953 [Elliptochloris bilobata]|uniref:phosphatidylinositol 3-kinase n=1 Tax=Elliptochloris bilobata TaxID=381761 RepID=A0AAW1RE06_9CHLO